MIAIINDVQKLKQKSQLNNFDINFGALSIILSRNPILLINSIAKAEAKVIHIRK